MFKIEHFIENPDPKRHTLICKHDQRALDVVYKKNYSEEESVLSKAMRIAVAIDSPKDLYKIHKNGGKCNIIPLRDAIKHRKEESFKWLLRNTDDLKFHDKEIINMIIEYDMVDVFMSMPDLRLGKKMFLYLLDKAKNPEHFYSKHVCNYYFNDKLYLDAAEIILRRDLDMELLQHKHALSHRLKLKLLRRALQYKRIEYAKKLLKQIDHFHMFPEKIARETDDQALLDEIKNKTHDALK